MADISKQAPGKRILASVRQAVAHARGERVAGTMVHDFDVRKIGEREVVTHDRNGVRDPVPRIRKAQDDDRQ